MKTIPLIRTLRTNNRTYIVIVNTLRVPRGLKPYNLRVHPILGDTFPTWANLVACAIFFIDPNKIVFIVV